MALGHFCGHQRTHRQAKSITCTDPALKFVYCTAISLDFEGLTIDYSYLTKYLDHRDILGALNLSQKQVY